MEIAVIILLAAVVIVGRFLKAAILAGQRSFLTRKIHKISGFTNAKTLVSMDRKSGLGLSDESGELALVGGHWEGVAVFTAREIISCEVFIDGQSDSRTNRGSQLGGAVVGGLLLGGAGAIIGGLSGSKRTTKKISSVELRITVDDSNNPLHDVILLDEILNAKDERAKMIVTTARTWHARIAALMRHADVPAEADLATFSAATAPQSVADEIEKLFNLRERGLLTQSEFDHLKSQLL